MFWLMAAMLPAAASHLVGGELTYKYLDATGPAGTPFRYQLTALVYFSKEPGSSAPDGTGVVPIIVYDKAQPSSAPLLNINVERGLYRELITPFGTRDCPVQVPVVTLAIYSTIVSLPPSESGYLAVINENARNNGITNVAYIPFELLNLALQVDIAPTSIPNSSPTFSSDAQSVICLGDDSYVLNNAYDADGDRLSYQFSTPGRYVSNAGLLPVFYSSGYSAAQPFGSTGAASMDANTGLARYRAQSQGLFLLAIDVQEFRTIGGREVLLSTTRRDIQVVVRSCPGAVNQAPTFTAPTMTQLNYQVQEGNRVAFPIAATDPDGQRLTMQVSSILLDGPNGIDAAVNGLPGTPTGSEVGIVEVTGQSAATATFSLQAGCGLARAQPYDVLAVVTDNVCNSKNVAAVFRITVTPAPSLAPLTGLTGAATACTEEVVTYTAQGPAFTAYHWTASGGEVLEPGTGRTVQVRWTTSGPNRVSVSGLTPIGCLTQAVFQDVSVGGGPGITGPLTYCRSASTGLRYAIAGPPAAYQWRISEGILVSGQGTNEAVIDVTPGGTALLQAGLPNQACPSALRVSPDLTCLSFYNVITPNGDNQNDRFIIDNVERHPNTSLTIYNRWGRQVFQTDNYQNTYDGEGNGPGVYYYLCQLADGTRYKGWFELLR